MWLHGVQKSRQLPTIKFFSQGGLWAVKLIEQLVSLLAVPAVCLAEVVALMWLYLACKALENGRHCLAEMVALI